MCVVCAFAIEAVTLIVSQMRHARNKLGSSGYVLCSSCFAPSQYVAFVSCFAQGAISCYFVGAYCAQMRRARNKFSV
jgi:hypothetical protein